MIIDLGVTLGPISVTIHLIDDESKEENLEKLEQFYRENKSIINDKVDAHVVIDKFARQFNYWRNLARYFARTDFILALDADFAPVTDFQKSIQQKHVIEKLRLGTAAFVLPALEFVGLVENTSLTDFPTTKTSLLNLMDNGYVESFHGRWNRGHAPTNLKRWLREDKVYPVRLY